MPAPFIFIATNNLKPGAIEAERHRVRDLSRFLEARSLHLGGFTGLRP
jgi:hypothetical protein